MEPNKQLKYLALFVVVFFTLSLIGAYGIKNYARANFNTERLERIIISKAGWRDVTDDLCKYEIYGDPADAGQSYAKLNFYCKEGKSSHNTLDLRAVKKDNLKGLIEEYLRIVGFVGQDVISGESWECFTNNQEITDWSTGIEKMMTIDCRQK